MVRSRKRVLQVGFLLCFYFMEIMALRIVPSSKVAFSCQVPLVNTLVFTLNLPGSRTVPSSWIDSRHINQNFSGSGQVECYPALVRSDAILILNRGSVST